MHRKVLTIAAAFLTACSQTSELRKPAPPVPLVWPVTSAADHIGSVEAAKTHWRDFFPDPQLQRLIATALENNRDLRIAAARVLEARAQYGFAKADQLPGVGALGSGTLTHAPTDVLTGGAAATTRRIDLSASSTSFELDFWGRLAGLSEAARQSYLSTEESRRAVHLSLVADVAGAYFSLLQMDELAALARSVVETNEQTLGLIDKGRELGGAGDYEYQQAAATLESARANLNEYEHQRAVATNRLNYLIGNAPLETVPGMTLEEQAIDDDLAPGLPAEVLLARPDVIAAEQRLMAAHANVGAARAAFLPKVLLTAGLGVASQGLVGLFTGGGAWSFLPSITAPLFDGGRTAAGLDVAEARKVIAVAEYEKTIQMAFREIADLLSSRTSLAKQLHASAFNVKSQQLRLHILRGRYQAGLISYVEVLAGQRELVSARQAGVQVLRARLEVTAQLYKALGGGDSKA